VQELRNAAKITQRNKNYATQQEAMHREMAPQWLVLKVYS